MKARRRVQGTAASRGLAIRVIAGDFFKTIAEWGLGAPLLDGHPRFDAVVGNPPFVRYQQFPEVQRAAAFSLMAEFGFHPNRLTNAWVPFLALSSLCLGENGRLAMVIPAELLQVTYAAEIRKIPDRILPSHYASVFPQIAV